MPADQLQQFREDRGLVIENPVGFANQRRRVSNRVSVRTAAVVGMPWSSSSLTSHRPMKPVAPKTNACRLLFMGFPYVVGVRPLRGYCGDHHSRQ
jgi:hypothetical protein